MCINGNLTKQPASLGDVIQKDFPRSSFTEMSADNTYAIIIVVQWNVTSDLGNVYYVNRVGIFRCT